MNGLALSLSNYASPASAMGVENTLFNALAGALQNQQTGMERLSNQFLQAGIDHYQYGRYDEAATAFRASTAISPHSPYAADTARYLAQTYLQLEKPEKAIETYQAAVERMPTSDVLRSSLAQLYFAEERYEEAAAQYRSAVQLNPSSTNRYSFGESLLKIKNYSEAEHQFREVRRLAPESHVGDYGLGKLHAQTEQFDEAIAHFEKALALSPDFHDALAEIGYTYADMGDIENARKVQEDLERKDDALALTLNDHILEKEPPRFAIAFANSSFPYYATKGFPVSAIDPYLENAGAKKSLTMKFLFSKEMEPDFVENRFNWSITRASSGNLAKTYNFGDEIPETEVTLNRFPDYVLFDREASTATLGFTIRQNQTADGTIDPAHIVFKFDGEDIYGQPMDPQGDEFSGFSKIA